jgi:hypothetical protein
MIRCTFVSADMSGWMRAVSFSLVTTQL